MTAHHGRRVAVGLNPLVADSMNGDEAVHATHIETIEQMALPAPVEESSPGAGGLRRRARPEPAPLPGGGRLRQGHRPSEASRVARRRAWGRVRSVVVTKLDRISRSLADLLDLMKLFE